MSEDWKDEAILEMSEALKHYASLKKYTFEPPNNFRALTPAEKVLHKWKDKLPTQTNNKENIMVDNQHKQIKGYRDLTVEEIELMNKAKELASQVGDFVASLDNAAGLDMRWVNIGKTDLQKGFMSLIRGIAQPTTF